MLDPRFYDRFPELSAYKKQIVLLPEDPSHFTELGEVMDRIQHVQQRYVGIYTRKHIVIQSGCDTFCTFCTTIQARGSHTSRTMADILEEIRQFEASGGKEIVLTGINLGAWGASHTRKTQESRFPELLECILTHTTMPRIRISSI